MLHIRRLTAAVALALLAFHPGSAMADGVFGARFPALSPDGGTVVFSYWGDLWTAPVDGSANAVRLTDHQAFDWLPQYSPDGSEIAFLSQRSGNTDIWVIPAQGGLARQVTTFSGTDTLCGWSPDGRRIIFSSGRDLWSSDIFHVDASGETAPVQVTCKDHDVSAEAVMLPDGGFVYARGGGPWWRKGYRGTRQHDIWHLDADLHATRLTTHNGYDHWPMVSSGGSTIFYVSDSDGIANVWAMDLDGSNKRQVTHHTADGVQFPSICPGGDTIVYEQQGRLWTVGAGAGTPRKLNISIAAETKDNWVKKQNFNNETEDYAVSPNGKYVVFTSAGDLWAVKDPGAYKDDEKPDQDLSLALRLTASDDAREVHPVFSNSNTVFAYCSDADGDYNVYTFDLRTMESKRISTNSADDLSPVWDPGNDNRIFYLSGNRALVVHDLETDKVRTVLESDMRRGLGSGGFAVSPDGQWVAWEDGIAYGQSEVFVARVDGEGEPVNISRHNEGDGDPQWSPDGSRLLYFSNRNERRELLVVDLLPEPEKYDIEFLFPEDRDSEEPEPERDGEDEDNGDDEDQDGEDEGNGDDDEDNGDDDEKDEDGNGKEEDKDKETKLSVEIDFRDIHLRGRRIGGNDFNGSATFSDDGKWVIYETRLDGGSTEVWAAKADGSENKRFMGGGWSSPLLADNGKRIYYRDGGTLKYAKFSDGNHRGGETLNSRGEYWLDQRARWRQMYREAWRAMREQFYDANMHGADWDAVYAQYLPYVEAIGTPEEFSLMFEEVLGELNGSHMGISLRDNSFSTSGPSSGSLGLEFDPSFAGPGLLVSHVTYQGPSDLPGIELAAGDVVLAIDGTPVDVSMRWLDLLDDRAGEPVALQVADGDAAREVVVKATSYGSYLNLLYREWEMANEDYVTEQSNGRIGYIHIRSMSGGELRQFEREFIAEHIDKDALIVDVRFNSGGLIHEQLFDLLDRHHFGYSAKRDQPLTVQPASAFDKPAALLINQRSASDAEIFPSGWRILGLGPVIGVDTYGAVIGTSSYRLIDGSSIRMPHYGWYDINMRNLEVAGTPPDHYVEVHPDDLRNGVDAQLDKALELMLAELE